MKRTLPTLFALTAPLIIGAPALGQASTQNNTTFSGVVTDPNGAIVAGAKGSATNLLAGQKTEAITDAQGQHTQEAGGCRLETKYDREADTTTVQCDLHESVESAIQLMVQACACFQGKQPNETAQFWLGLAAYQGKANRRTPPSFKEATTLSLRAGSTRLEVPVIGYRSDFFEMNRLLAEQARAEINRADLQKLLDAKSLVGKWGGVEFKFSDASLAALKDFIARQTLVAAGDGSN